MSDESRLLAKFQSLVDRWVDECGVEPEIAERLALLQLGSLIAAEPDVVELPPSLHASVAEALEHEMILDRLLLTLFLDFTEEQRAGLRRLAEAAADRHGTAGVNVLLSWLQEAAGDLAGARRSLRRALRADIDHEHANREMGALHELLGDPHAARRHLDRIGAPAWGWAAIADSLGPPVKAGRNEPCPCGSGAKFKRCCSGTGGWSLGMRIDLLPARIAAWFERPANWHRLLPLAEQTTGATFAEEVLRVLDAVHHPTLQALHLFEGGGLAGFVDDIAPLLRADELAVVRGWPSARHRVWAIGRPEPHDRWQLVDVASGEVVVAAHLDEEHLDPEAEHIFAVVVPHPVPRPGEEAGGHLMWGTAHPVGPGEVAPIVELLRREAGAAELARMVVAPTLARFGQLLELDRSPDPGLTERVTWLLGEANAAAMRGQLDLLDDLVTTTFMRGGGMSDAADWIRDAALRVVRAEPPEAWEAAQRLVGAGVERGVALVEIAAARALAQHEGGRDPDRVAARFVAKLEALPVDRLAG